ncbi:MAG: hypothetical protein JNM56_05395, partial [Planctomycetia bacterium]|nr:hypothetical protein [Planctomycetia bacterium]
ATGAAGLLLGYLGILSARLLWPATGETAVERSLLGQAVWLTALILFGAALLALSTSLAALGGWVWRASRAWRVLLVGGGALVVAAGAVSLGDGFAYFGLAVYAMLAAGVTGITWLARATYHSEQVGSESSSSVRTEPFLHRLLGRVGGSPTKTRQTAPTNTAPVPTGLDDIEKGKVIQRWDTGEVWRGRQKTLERPVLVWLDRTPTPPDAPLPGVYVRHPGVLVLHAVGRCPEGRYLVTEFSTGTPLAEYQQRQVLSAHDAVQLAIGLAQAMQAVHDQEACMHGLRPELILLRGGLDPVLCPWCLPSQAAADRVRDCQSLARMLRDWLPEARHQPFAVVHAVVEAAASGRYMRPADFAGDLTLARQDATCRGRSRRVSWCIFLLLVLPWLALLLGRLATGANLSAYLISALIPAAILLGYQHARTLVLLRRFRYVAPLPPSGPAARWLPVQLAVLALPPALVLHQGSTGLLASALLLGYWILGAGLGGLATLGGWLLRTLRPRGDAPSATDDGD